MRLQTTLAHHTGIEIAALAEVRVIYKLLLLVFKAPHNTGPLYLRDLLHVYQPRRSLRSSSQGLLLKIPSSRLKSYGDRYFSFAGSTEWNKLPLEVRSCCTVSSFKSAWKTFFFYGLLHWLISIIHCKPSYILTSVWFVTVSVCVCGRVCVCVRDTPCMSVRLEMNGFFSLKCA